MHCLAGITPFAMSCVHGYARPDARGCARMSSLGTRRTVWLRFFHDTHYAGLAGGVDPVGFAFGVGEGSVGFDRVVFGRVDSEEFAVL